MRDKRGKESKGNRAPRDPGSSLGQLRLNVGADKDGFVQSPMVNWESEGLRLVPKKPTLLAPRGSGRYAPAASTQVAMYWLNLPRRDSYYWRGVAMQMNERILAFNKKYGISFFDQYPEALLGGTAPTTLYDVSAQVEALVEVLRDYDEASTYLVGCMANEFIFGKAVGRANFARWGSAMRINVVRGRYRLVDNIPINPWVVKYVCENTRLATGNDGYDFNAIAFPMWITDLRGRRLMVPDTFRVTAGGLRDLSQFVGVIPGNLGPAETLIPHAASTDFLGFGANGSSHQDGYIVNMLQRLGNQWIGYMMNTPHAQYLADASGRLTQVFRELGFLTSSLKVDDVKSSVLNNGTVGIEDLAKEMVYAFNEQGTWKEKNDDFRLYVRENPAAAYLRRTADQGYAAVRYLGTEAVFVASDIASANFPYSTRNPINFGPGTGDNHTWDDGDVYLIDARETAADILHPSAMAVYRYNWNNEQQVVYGLSEKSTEALFNAESVGKPRCFLSPADVQGGCGINDSADARCYLRQEFRPLINTHDIGQCGFYAIASFDDQVGMWTRFLRTITPTARCVAADAAAFGRMMDVIVFVGDGLMMNPLQYFSRRGLTYGQWLDARNKTYIPFKPYQVEPPSDYDPGFLSGLQTQDSLFVDWDLGAFSQVAGSMSNFNGYFASAVTNFKQMEFEHRLRTWWYVGRVIFSTIFGVANASYNAGIMALSEIRVLNYLDALMKRHRDKELAFPDPNLRLSGSSGSIPKLEDTYLQAAQQPRSFPNRMPGARKTFGRSSSDKAPRGKVVKDFKPLPTDTTTIKSDEGFKLPAVGDVGGPTDLPPKKMV